MKTFILSVVLLLGITFNSNAHINFTPTSAEDFLRHTLEVDIHEMINADVSEEERLKAFLPFIRQNIDIEYTLKYILRTQVWLTATESEKEQALMLMQQRIAKLYLENLEKIRDGRVVIKGVKEGRGSITKISTQVYLEGRLPFNVDFAVKQHDDGNYKIMDIVVEGIRLLPHIRADYRESVKADGIAGLIKQLQNEINKIS